MFILIILSLLAKTSVGGPFPNRLIAPFVSCQKHCNLYLAGSHICARGRFTWRRNSVLLFLANALSSLKQRNGYADLPSFLCPCFITGESFSTDLLLLKDTNILYILELTVGFETNMQSNRDRKAAKYSTLISDLSFSYRKSSFINLFMSAIGAVVLSAIRFCHCLMFYTSDKTIQKRIMTKAMNISIRSSYYIFCHRNKPWTNTELLTL